MVYKDQDPANDNAADIQIEKKIVCFKKQKHQATIWSKLNWFCKLATYSFVSNNKNIRLKLFKQHLAVEQTKTARKPDLYSKDN